MQANPISRSPEREDKRTQRAVLSLVLHEFPTQMSRADLRYRGFGDGEALDRAVDALALVGLGFSEGEVVLPTLAARHFVWLELA